jgi:hypothetical protein
MGTKTHKHAIMLDSPGIRRALLPARKRCGHKSKYKNYFYGMAVALPIIEGKE